MKKINIENIDDYIAGFPKSTQKLLKEIRAAIKKAAPQTEEAIKYGIPTFMLNGNLAHFGGYEHHIGFYPAPRAIEVFKKELSKYEGGKGTIQFPIDKPLPIGLIKKIVKFRVKEHLEKVKVKKKK
ncbi:MAG: DUF1801 domain-containing protein [Bacteroidota bacterium]|nr:DUF1801 domain-containing protein [Bacteroidota bacterium]